MKDGIEDTNMSIESVRKEVDTIHSTRRSARLISDMERYLAQPRASLPFVDYMPIPYPTVIDGTTDNGSAGLGIVAQMERADIAERIVERPVITVMSEAGRAELDAVLTEAAAQWLPDQDHEVIFAPVEEPVPTKDTKEEKPVLTKEERERKAKNSLVKDNFRTGKFFYARIGGSLTNGQLVVRSKHSTEELNIMLCQNLRIGGNFTDLTEAEQIITFPYEGSWVTTVEFGVRHIRLVTDNVEFLCIGDSQEEIDELIVIKKQLKVVGSGLYLHNVEDTNNGEKLFSFQEHPDCCGSTLLFGFCEGSNTTYSRYTTIIDDPFLLKEVTRILYEMNKSSKMIHLASYQKGAMDFVEALGAELICTYNNTKSDNDIFVYHLEISG